MEQKNVFIKGHKTDLDPSFMDNQTFRKAKNFRFINRDGRGFVGTPLNSNEKEFEIKPGYVPLNGIEYKGIYYLVSYNARSKKTEIGSFPSPNGSGVIERIYRPLQTLKKDTKDLDFNTDRLGLSWHNSLDIVAREIYNGSVNLYLCDHENPNYVINTGFDQEGKSTGEELQESELPENVYQFKSPKSFPGLSSFSINEGGTNKPGSYYVYIRYLDKSLTPTTFVNSFGPIMLGDGNYGSIDDSGKTTKSISLSLKDLDVSYPYFQLGISRKSSNDSVPVDETYLIDKLFDCSETKEVTVSGSEDTMILSNEELLLENSSFVSSKSHTIHDGKYVGANWKSKKRDYNTLAEIAKRIEPGFKLRYKRSRFNYYDYMGELASDINSPSDLYNDVGYMRGEIYPFGVVFVFTDGSKSQPLPIKGLNFNKIDEQGNYEANEKGLVMMPDFNFSEDLGDLNNAIFAEFNFQATKEYLQDKEISKDIKTFYIVRGDRIKNKIYSGFAYPASYGVVWDVDVNDEDYNLGRIFFFGNENSNEKNAITLGKYSTEEELTNRIKGVKDTSDFRNFKEKSLYVPFLSKTVKAFTFYAGMGWYPERYITQKELMSDKHYFFYSPDHIFSPSADLENYYFTPIYQFDIDYFNGRSKLNLDPDDSDWNDYRASINGGREIIRTPYNLYNENNPEAIETDSFSIKNGIGRGTNKFSSILNQNYKKEKEPPQGETGWFLEGLGDTQANAFSNANIKFNEYIGLTFKNPHNHKNGVIGALTKYRTKDEYYASSLNSFNTKNTVYKKVSKHYSIKYLTSNDNYPVGVFLGKGDTFINTSFIRQAKWIGNPFEDRFTDKDYSHAVLLGLCVESELNTFMRNEVPSYDEEGNEFVYSFFPKILDKGVDFYDWFLYSKKDEDIYEAMQINPGYSNTLPNKASYGYDESIPDVGPLRPTRIYYSGDQKTNAILDSFSNINPGSFYDYPAEDGEIMSINSVNGNLFSVNRLGIMQYYTGESELGSNPSTGNIIVNSNYRFLSPKARKISDYGVQHHKAIIHAGSRVFGVDAYKKVIWQMAVEHTSTGQAMLMAKDLAKEHLVNKKVLSLISDYLEDESRYNEYIDMPSKTKGIVLGHDPEYNEILFSFYNRNSAKAKTYVFSLDLNAFIDEFSIVSGHYFNLNNKLYSVSPYNKEEVFLHNKPNEVLRFYGKNHLSLIQIIVTGVSGESNANSYEKEFFNCQIRSPKVDFKDVIFRTETQKSVLSPFIEDNPGMFFRNPNYYEGYWNIPIPLQSNTGNIYLAGSEMRGDYLSIEMRYEKNKMFFIKNVKTEYEISF